MFTLQQQKIEDFEKIKKSRRVKIPKIWDKFPRLAILFGIDFLGSN